MRDERGGEREVGSEEERMILSFADGQIAIVSRLEDARKRDWV